MKLTSHYKLLSKQDLDVWLTRVNNVVEKGTCHERQVSMRANMSAIWKIEQVELGKFVQLFIYYF